MAKSIQLAVVLLGLVLFCQISRAEDCKRQRPIRIAGLEYESGQFSVALVEELLARGIGCVSVEVKGGTLESVSRLIAGDIDIVTELWDANSPRGWTEALAAGKVRKLGRGFGLAQEGWFVPRYLVEGPSAKAPLLRSVFDLAEVAPIFASKENPKVGRFYNCPLGTQCELVNTKKLIAYGISSFVNYLPFDYRSMQNAIETALKNKDPIVFYNWQPNTLSTEEDLVQLVEPSYDAEIWASLQKEADPKHACAYPSTTVSIAANAEFLSQYHGVAELLQRMDLSGVEILDAISRMKREQITPTAAAMRFLIEHKVVWFQWVDTETADRIASGLR
jgi:glycine betaine/proline transport system substrate-binding protein